MSSSKNILNVVFVLDSFKTKNIYLMGSSQKRRRAGKNCEEECYLEEDKNIIKIFCLKSELL